MASSESTEERLKAALADRYRPKREIGSGGMATVYLAQDLKHAQKSPSKCSAFFLPAERSESREAPQASEESIGSGLSTKPPVT